MRNALQLQQALKRIKNVTAFAREHKLPSRTIWRLRAGGVARVGTLMRINAALDKFTRSEI